MAPRLNKCQLTREFLVEFVLLSRFHSVEPNPLSPRYATIKSIADVVNVSTATVRRIISCATKEID